MATQVEVMTGKGKETYYKEAHPTKLCYTQGDFEKIINQGICYNIPVEVLRTIRSIDERIKQKASVQQKHFEHKRFHVPKNGGNWKGENPVATKNWTTKEPVKTGEFKPTASLVDAKATDTAKIVQRIKLNLNKLSQQNYEKLQKEMVEDLDVLLTDLETKNKNDKEVDFSLIGDLFRIMSKSNDIRMSELYAKCYFHWVQSFEPVFSLLFQQVIDEGINEYCRQLKEFKIMDADRDGDAFCKYSRFITEHRGKAAFLIQYAKLQGGIVKRLYDILKNDLISEIEFYVEDVEMSPLKKMFVEEWIEHVAIFLNVGDTLWVNCSVNDYFVKIQGVLEKLSQTDVKRFPNMTVRSKFKLQGVLSAIAQK